jgi:hypothetical protein
MFSFMRSTSAANLSVGLILYPTSVTPKSENMSWVRSFPTPKIRSDWREVAPIFTCGGEISRSLQVGSSLPGPRLKRTRLKVISDHIPSEYKY